MKTITLGVDLAAPNVVLGLMRISKMSDEAVRELVGTARDAGIDFFDHADIYGDELHGCERRFAEAMQLTPSEREQVTIQSKAGIVKDGPYFDFSYEHLVEAVDGSLRALQTDYLDVLLLHRPDALVEPDEVARAFDELEASGKVRAFGVSNHTPAQVMALQAHLPIEIVTTQPEFSAASLTALRDGTLDQAMELGLTTLAWSPLGGGRLGDGGGAGVRPELIAALDRLAEREGAERAAVALAFVLCHPASPVPLIGTQQPERIKAAVAALHVRLDRRDVYEIVQASDGAPLP